MNKLSYICKEVDNQPQELNYKDKDELLDQAVSIISHPYLELLDLIIEDKKVLYTKTAEKIIFRDSLTGDTIKEVKIN